MNVCSIGFLTFCSALSLAILLNPKRQARQILLATANLIFLAVAMPNKRSMATLAAFVVATYGVLRLVKARPSRALVLWSVGLVVAVFLYLKRYSFLELLLPERTWGLVPEFIGISYMLFKFIHMVVDQSQGQLSPFTFFSYANYQLSFFTLPAGPIQRYNDYYQYWNAETLPAWDARQTLLCWNRLLTGMVKVGLLAPITWDLFEAGRTQLLSASNADAPRNFLLLFYAYPVYMYLNFSGYTDAVIAAARLSGLTLPENFNRPYLARNVIDYWNRWHISLTHWIRDYVFMTLYKLGIERFQRSTNILGYSLLFVSLFVSGIWHGSTLQYAVFGAIHGLGAATNQAYGDWLKKRLGRDRFKKYQNNRLIYWVAMLVTFHFVCFAFVFFSSGVWGAADIFGAIGRYVLSLRWSVGNPLRDPLTVAILVAFPLLLWSAWDRERVLAGVDKFRLRLASAYRPLLTSVLVKAAFVTIMLISLWALEKEPEVAYMRF